MKLLVLGGTKFLGRPIVEEALKRGHEVTLFNRGETNPDLFPEAEKLRGNRDGDLEALRGRTWDAVVDTAGYVPRIVRQTAELLRGQVEHYTFVSSISAYAGFAHGPREGDATAELDDPDTEEILPNYGGLKAACEQVVRETYGDGALIVRPGLIVGPNDPTGRFTYWPHRVARGGDVLAPEPRDKRVQFIDVRDLGEWIVRMVEARTSGDFNATGPDPTPTIEEFLSACREATGSDARFVWATPEFLREHEVGEWMNLPLWVGVLDPEFAGMMETDVSKALDAGLTFRALAQTIRDTLAQAETTDEAGLAPDRERELLDAWASDTSRGREPSAGRPA